MPLPLSFRLKMRTVIGDIPAEYTGLNTPCHNWIGSKTSYGYGVIHDNKKRLCAHRVALELKIGKPLRFNALHKCDNRACVNPDHLFEGTQRENNLDAMRKGRMVVPVNIGRKLDDDRVLEIRRLSSLGLSQRKLAARFGVSQRTIGFIVRNELWKNVKTREERTTI